MGQLQLYGMTNPALGKRPSVTPDDEHIVRTRAIGDKRTSAGDPVSTSAQLKRERAAFTDRSVVLALLDLDPVRRSASRAGNAHDKWAARPALSGDQRKPAQSPDAECGDDAEDHDVNVPLAAHDILRSRSGIPSQL